MSRPKQRKGGRVTPKGTGSPRRPSTGGSPSAPDDGLLDGPLSGPWTDEPDPGDEGGLAGLIAAAGDAITTGHPAELLVLTSAVVEEIDEGAELTWSSVVDDLAASVGPATTALLYALRPLAPDEWRRRISAELAGRSTPGLPAWIAAISDVEVSGVWVRHDDDGDEDDDVFVVGRWPTGQELTVIVNVGRHPEPVVRDALLAPVDVVARSASVSIGTDGPIDLAAVDPADARAFVDAAVRRRATSSSVPESEDWPSTRPLLRWLLSTLPEGGDDRRPGATR